MKVVISAGGRFHAIHLAHQLQKYNLLSRLFSFSYRKSDAKYISRNLVTPINSCKLLDFLFSKLQASKLINRSIFNSYKDDLFDSIVSKKIKKIEQFDLFVGWSNYSLRTMDWVKKIGAKAIIESGSSHIIEQKKILESECEKWGVSLQPIYPKTISKMCAEYSAADYIMTLSEYSRQSFIRQGIMSNKVLMVPCGIDVDFFLSETDCKIKNKFRVIVVGLLCLRKGIQYLLQAWNQLNLPVDKAELVLVGCIQSDFELVLKNFKLRKNIIFYGSTDRAGLKKLYNNSSIFVLPSVEDGFGMVLGEAMACGLPVICTENVGAAEMVKNNKNGFVVPAASSQALAEKILWCYQNQDTLVYMGKDAKEWVKNWSWDNYGKNIIEVYKKVLQE
jgi:glycosyltransferase involved in cell wall biosynthesis